MAEKVWMITGASRGLGTEIAKEAVREAIQLLSATQIVERAVKPDVGRGDVWANW